MSKSLMILGAGRGQLGLYKACASLGVHTVSASIEGQYPALGLADESCTVDISKPEQVLSASRFYPTDGFATSCMDTGMESLGLLNDSHSKPGVTLQSAKLCFDKLSLWNALASKDIPVPRTLDLNSIDDIGRAEKELGWPLVLKQNRSQGSRGVRIVHSLEEAKRAYKEMLSTNQIILAQEYIEGTEFGAQAFVESGAVKLFLPHGDIMDETTHITPIGHYYPPSISKNVAERTRVIGEKAIRACSFDNCAVNIDFKLHGDDVIILEMTARVGANGLPELTGKMTGRNYYEDIVRVALGEPTEPFSVDDAGAAVVVMLTAERRISDHVRGAGLPDGVEIYMYEPTNVPRESCGPMGNSLGQITVTGDDLESCLQKLRKCGIEVGAL